MSPIFVQCHACSATIEHILINLESRAGLVHTGWLVQMRPCWTHPLPPGFCNILERPGKIVHHQLLHQSSYRVGDVFHLGTPWENVGDVFQLNSFLHSSTLTLNRKQLCRSFLKLKLSIAVFHRNHRYFPTKGTTNVCKLVKYKCRFKTITVNLSWVLIKETILGHFKNILQIRTSFRTKGPKWEQ